MKCLLGIALIAAVAGTAALAPTTPPVSASAVTDEPYADVLLVLDAQVDVAALLPASGTPKRPLARQHADVIRALQSTARDTQRDLLDTLANLRGLGHVRRFQPFWIVNAVRVEATKPTIAMLAARPDVAQVLANSPCDFLCDAAEPAPSDPPRDVEHNVVACRAPEAWALGYDGSGVLVSNIDTGVDANHPALASRWAGVANPNYAGHPEWAWLDLVDNPPTTFPRDYNGHGTHTMGTLCGGPPGAAIGVAPGATWIAANTVAAYGPTFISDVIWTFQWIADPDGDPETSWDVPAVCSNSWGLNPYIVPPCYNVFWPVMDAVEAAGVVILFSAGSDTLWVPGDRATDAYRTCAISAVDTTTPGWPSPPFVPHGPTYCTPDGGPDIKPELVGPGVGIRSSIAGGYSIWSGVSMAVPHVAGAVAILRQANPELSVVEIKEILYQTAVDLGAPGEDNTTGWGMIDVYAALLLALSGGLEGACCLPNHECQSLTEDACAALGGLYLGDFADCTVVECPAGAFLGDMNCDGHVDFDDIDPFVLALAGQETYEAELPSCYFLNADCDMDGDVDFGDIDPFVQLLTG